MTFSFYFPYTDRVGHGQDELYLGPGYGEQENSFIFALGPASLVEEGLGMHPKVFDAC